MKRLALLTFLIPLVITPAASAGPIVGIGEQHASPLATPLFSELGVKRVRITVPWDATKPGFARDQADSALAEMRLRGIEPLLVVGSSRYKGGYPDTKSYAAGVKALRARHSWVKYWSPANEANLHNALKKKPKKVASFYRSLRAVCRAPKCLVLSPTVLDEPNLFSWSRAFNKAVKSSQRPKVWLLHNYIDANAFKTKRTDKFMKLVRGKYVWLAETGGLIRGTGKNSKKWPKGEDQQVKVFNFLTGPYAKRYRQVTRVYIYQWQSSPTANWDSGIVNYDGSPRKVYFTIKNYIAKQGKS